MRLCLNDCGDGVLIGGETSNVRYENDIVIVVTLLEELDFIVNKLIITHYAVW